MYVSHPPPVLLMAWLGASSLDTEEMECQGSRRAYNWRHECSLYYILSVLYRLISISSWSILVDGGPSVGREHHHRHGGDQDTVSLE